MSQTAAEFDELGLLTSALCDGEITPEQAVRLEQIVGRSDAARRFFLQYVQLHGELYWEHAAAGRESLAPPAAVTVAVQARKPRAAARRWPLVAAAVAAGLLLAVTLAILPAYRAWRNAGGLAAAPRYVARITRTVEAAWAPGSAPSSVDLRLLAGQQLDLRAGLAEIAFDAGATVILQGPARLDLNTVGSASLDEGALTARVPAPARGFTVQAPNATVVDLGTEFGLAVERGGRSEVRVFAGSVSVRPGTGARALEAQQQVTAGQAVYVLPGPGGTARIEPSDAQGRKFVRRLPGQPALAGSVAQLRTLVAAHPKLIHHYTFEGTTPEEKCRDRQGDLHLSETIMYAGQGGGSLDYAIHGPDGVSNAVQPFRSPWAGNANGVGLQSQGAFQPPPAMTVEVLLSWAGGADEQGYVGVAVGTREDDRRCGFFIVAVDKGQLAHLMDGNAPWVESGVELLPGDWYYVASTFRSAGSKTVVNTYLANLTRGEQRLAHVVQDALTPGTPGTSRLGIGKGFNAETAHAYPWSGGLDEVAIYAEALDRGTIQSHLNAITGASEGGETGTPEPGPAN